MNFFNAMNTAALGAQAARTLGAQRREEERDISRLAAERQEADRASRASAAALGNKYQLPGLLPIAGAAAPTAPRQIGLGEPSTPMRRQGAPAPQAWAGTDKPPVAPPPPATTKAVPKAAKTAQPAATTKEKAGLTPATAGAAGVSYVPGAEWAQNISMPYVDDPERSVAGNWLGAAGAQVDDWSNRAMNYLRTVGHTSGMAAQINPERTTVPTMVRDAYNQTFVRNQAEREAASLRTEAADWYKSGQADDFFGQNPDQIPLAENDPLAYYVGTVKPVLANLKPVPTQAEGELPVESIAQAELNATGVQPAAQVAGMPPPPAPPYQSGIANTGVLEQSIDAAPGAAGVPPPPVPTGNQQFDIAPEAMAARIPSAVYMANPQAITPDITNEMTNRDNLVRLAEAYRAGGHGASYAEVVAQINASNDRLYYLQGMQGIQEMATANDPRRLSAVMSHYMGGTPVQIVPYTDGTYAIAVNGEVMHEGLDGTTIARIGQEMFDTEFVKRMAKRQESDYKHQQALQLEQAKGANRLGVAQVTQAGGLSQEMMRNASAERIQQSKNLNKVDISSDGEVIFRTQGGVYIRVPESKLIPNEQGVVPAQIQRLYQ